MTLEANTHHSISGLALWHWRREKQQQFSELQNEVTQAHDQQNLARELDWLIREVTDLDRLALRLELYKDKSDLKSTKSLQELEQIWSNRILKSKPLQYLLGYCNWRHFKLQVSPAVLIPRPETEELIEIVGEVLQQNSELAQGDWVDLGTGSGAIALGLADLMPNANIHAVDISGEALAIAKSNTKTLEMSDRIQFWQGSWFEPLPHPPGSLSGICSNPPYIPTQIVQTLQPEVVNHEPHLALDGGEDGLRDIRHLIQTANVYLRDSGFFIMECMAGQGEAIAHLMEAAKYQQVQIHHDLAGLDRFVSGRKQAD